MIKNICRELKNFYIFVPNEMNMQQKLVVALILYAEYEGKLLCFESYT